MKTSTGFLWLAGLFPIIFLGVAKISYSFGDNSILSYLGFGFPDEPILTRNITELIQSWPGFTAEEHYLTTEDGYRVLVERSYSKITQKNPIIIVHGIAMSAFGWVNRGNVSLARLLGDLGYDVWMLNYRGTWYSKGHVNLTTGNKNYWKYTIDNLGIYDVRAVVNFVSQETNRQSIYLGYSMGSSGFYMYSSTFPDEAKENVKAMIGIAPVINFKGVKSIALYSSYVWPTVKRLIYTFWNGEILPGYSLFLRPLTRFSMGMYIIQSFNNLLFGDDYEQMDPLHYPQFATQMLDSVCVELWSHYLQMYETGDFKRYDYGEKKNLEKYGTPTPPVYDLSKIEIPMAIFASENDWLATMENANQLYSEIQPSVRCGFDVIPHKKWNHIDFLIAKDVPKYFYKYLFKKIKDLSEGKCEA
ncbi:lipase member J-like [Diabrotica virgifera virgifera]|uniref:Lipase n=1 Tax=Diabrotica virgifera virgifera TaxID=50390 RepID=A0ABM5KJ20_DIAVI|nr:lipase member J-like [Diabrotica virgifera virgifera]